MACGIANEALEQLFDSNAGLRSPEGRNIQLTTAAGLCGCVREASSDSAVHAYPTDKVVVETWFTLKQPSLMGDNEPTNA